MADDETALKKALQTEVMGVKTRWADAIKLSKAKPDAPNAPLPIGVQRTIERPDDAYAYDVEELKVRLCIDALDSSTLPVHVEVTASVPTTLSDKMNGHIEKRWKAELQARGAGKGWLLEKILAWCESAYVELVTLEPTFVEMYEGCDDNGMTIRRYAITEPPEPKEESSEESEESEEEEEREFTEAEIEAMRKLKIKEAAEAEADRQWREERRKEAEKLGLNEEEKGPSKKDLEKMKKEKADSQGKRLRKQGAKANKFDAEAAGKTKNKKNGLMH